MRLGKRLSAILGLVCNANVVADIGSDHGILAAKLLDSGRAQRVIATDISKACAKNLEAKLQQFIAQGKAEVRQGDGLSVIAEGEADLVVMAGIGGREIIKILGGGAKGAKLFVFQPPQHAVELREYLNEKHFEILKDFIVKDRNKFYNTILARKSNTRQKLSQRDLKFGLTNFDHKSADFRLYIMDRIEKNRQTLSSHHSPKLEAETRELAELLEQL